MNQAKGWTGDRGTTSLLTGPRVRKDHPRIAALGDLDELQSCLGLVLAFLPARRRFEGLRRELRLIQSDLFAIGSLVAAPAGRGQAGAVKAVAAALARLDAGISAEQERSRPRGFVKPGGPPAAAFLHLARSVCRRAERSAVGLAAQDRRPRRRGPFSARRRGLAAPPACVVAYLNRLSSFLFSAAAAAAR
ncbi:MAG: cob(I)yrinic acid a,c-diamide adenosyltransferase [Elusimicrobia bacterium]|nr:cob(I)yrinic acid a,c-diamide adenosyltransferase [Elusimicrobiota bacterium]